MMRNSFEARYAKTLGPEWTYESIKLPYVIEHQYVPDFVDAVNKQIRETKGHWPAEDRAKILAVRKANPDWTITMVFQKPDNKINKGSKTSYADWCDKKGIAWVSA